MAYFLEFGHVVVTKAYCSFLLPVIPRWQVGLALAAGTHTLFAYSQ